MDTTDETKLTLELSIEESNIAAVALELAISTSDLAEYGDILHKILSDVYQAQYNLVSEGKAEGCDVLVNCLI